MRGEHTKRYESLETCKGSSPHARGTHDKIHAGNIKNGIIPACAGNTMTCTIPGRSARDHPRMRGEHSGVNVLKFSVGGSSPHARGTLIRRRQGRRGQGIIPACAGNTACMNGCKAGNRDHPRMRGEHRYSLVLVWRAKGSSPHARGTRRSCWSCGSFSGIIPACAGNTQMPQSVMQSSWDHPRMRGEHPYALAWDVEALGSSPHARGTHTSV